MKLALLFLAGLLSLRAAELQYFIHSPGTTSDGTPLSSTYAFSDTIPGQSSSVTLRVKNTSTANSYLIHKLSPGDTHFTASGPASDTCLPPNQSLDVTLSFAPAAIGPLSAPMGIEYLTYVAVSQCPSLTNGSFLKDTFATLSGNGVSPTLTDLQFTVHTQGSPVDGPALGSNYTFPDTPVGASSSIILRLRNTSKTQVYLLRAVSTGNNSLFPIDTSPTDVCLSANQNMDLNLGFVPSATGAASSSLGIAFLSFPASTGCPSAVNGNFVSATVAALSGNGISPTFNVSLTMDRSTNPISSLSNISFGTVTIGASKTATITVQNASPSPVTVDAPKIVAPVFAQSPFSLGSLANWPQTLAAGASASFTLSFTPAQAVLITNQLTLGSRTYSLIGVGQVGAGLQSLAVAYTLPSGVHYNITTASPVNFGSALTGTSQTFIFTVSNPQTNFSPQTISTIALSGSGFTLNGLPALPVTLKPGDSTQFSIVYAPAAKGTQTATLSIGTLVFSLTGTATAPTLNPTIQLSPTALSSAQQAQVSVQLASAPQSALSGTLTLSFTSAISGVSDDPAIQFLSTSGRNLNVSFSPSGVAGSFPNGQSTATFQTGTTAGTIKLILSFADGQTFTQSADLVPAPVQITASSATRQSPYLVLNLTAFDNTYSAGKLTFNFYDKSGTLLTPGGITADQTQAFKNYFFVNNQAGGAFTLQAQFPVTGDVNTIGSADVAIQNSAGQTRALRLTF